MRQWGDIAEAISDATRSRFEVDAAASLGGGSINRAFHLIGRDGTQYFAKLNGAQHRAMFAAEAAGLDAIAETRTLRVPRVIAHGLAGEYSFLVLEHLQLEGRGKASELGAKLAALHRSNAPQFGFARNNFIGTTPQPNEWKSSWVEFWREHRLGFQLEIARENGYHGRLQELGRALMAQLPTFFDGHAPQPSLLHGDLWVGNHAYLYDGTPVIFDPAPYYGDRECDVAMTELFGGYAQDFYAAYNATWPLDGGYTVRRDLYNLYHILNHANLFGDGYVRQAEKMMRDLLIKRG